MKTAEMSNQMDRSTTAASSSSSTTTTSPGLLRYVLGFLCVGIAWGFTTPFIRRAALSKQNEERQRKTVANQKQQSDKKNDTYSKHSSSWYSPTTVVAKLKGAWTAVLDLLSRPAYTIPLLVNLSGSALFFLIVGQAELSLTVPITNSLAFLFTVLGEWIAEGKSITRDTWIGMALVLSGIATCVHAKLDGV